tara:strand:- start:42 stop:230 length:189 start_codon:yes stop_codon:yes gene_type:complete
MTHKIKHQFQLLTKLESFKTNGNFEDVFENGRVEICSCVEHLVPKISQILGDKYIFVSNGKG